MNTDLHSPTMEPPEHTHSLLMARQQRLRHVMRAQQLPALLIRDGINILYACGAQNMTIFNTRTPARYLLLFADGPCVLFDYFGCAHLSEGLPTVDVVLEAEGLDHISSGGDPHAASQRMASRVAALMREHLGQRAILGVDALPFLAIDALRDQGLHLRDANPVLDRAKTIKLPEELGVMREAMRRVDHAVLAMREAIRPGITENALWSHYWQPLMASGGQYVVTRLLQTGHRTFPYFQECGERVIQNGDLVCLDTDAIGYLGYAVDYSRTFVCGDQTPSAAQQQLYALARAQLEHNAALLQCGRRFEEIAAKAWPIPQVHQDSRYYAIGHGLGMSGDFPNIPHATPGQPYPLQGGLEAGMVVCIESYIGSAEHQQGVKLENQYLITETGPELMSGAELCDRLVPAVNT